MREKECLKATLKMHKFLEIFKLIKSVPKTSWSSKKPLNIKPKKKPLQFLFFGLLFWIPKKQKPGIGTILNAIIIALVLDYTLPYLPNPENYEFKVLQVIIGVLITGLGSGFYLIANLGPGPRDGLMTGVQRITGKPIALIRTVIEITVVFFGWLLGGTAGLGTIIFALGIGPAVAIGIFLVSKNFK